MHLLSRRENRSQDLFDFRRDFDQIFNRYLFGRQGQPGERSSQDLFIPAADAWIDRDSKTYNIRVSLPGVDPKEVNINVQGNQLSISGERKFERENKEAEYIQNEFFYGSFERIFALPEGVEPNNVSAEYHNGVLEITAPLSAAALPKRIEIKSGTTARKMTA